MLISTFALGRAQVFICVFFIIKKNKDCTFMFITSI